VTADVVIAGGGVIGTAIAWRAAAAGLDVVLADPAQGDGASLVAAGMLAPVSEALFGEGALLRVNLLALARFPSFAAELEQVTGHRVGLRREGTLAVAYDAGDYAALMRLTRKPTPVRAATATVSASSRTPSSPERHSRASVRKASARTTRENERHANPSASGFWVSLVFGRARMMLR